MKNRIVGFLVIGISVLIGLIIWFFNRALTTIVNTACTHGTECPMWGTIHFQTNISIGIMAFVVIIGLYLVFFGKEERVVTRIKAVQLKVQPKKITKESYSKIMAGLGEEEKQVLGRLIEVHGTMFQSDLVDKTNFNKVKMTRILDKLEGRGVIERRRRGMTNMIILKHQ